MSSLSEQRAFGSTPEHLQDSNQQINSMMEIIAKQEDRNQSLERRIESLNESVERQEAKLANLEKSLIRRKRNLVVCIDGTSNQFGPRNTNVVEFYNRLVKDDEQLTFYNSGIGTFATPSWKSWRLYIQFVDSLIDFAIAWNFERILLSAYRWLSENYEDGDVIYLFGFSRGAYQIRVLAAMIDSVGLIRKGNLGQIPFAYELYAQTKSNYSILERILGVVAWVIWGMVLLSRICINILEYVTAAIRALATKPGQRGATREDIEAGEGIGRDINTLPKPNIRDMCRHFKETFSREHAKVHFGRDTVSSVGFIRDKTLPGTTDGMPNVTFVRHALALDERRVKFLPENFRGGDGPDAEKIVSEDGKPPHTKEVWFAGSHGDIGGGTVSNVKSGSSTVSNGNEFHEKHPFGPSLHWMLFEAAVAGVRLSKAPQPSEYDKIPRTHNSLRGLWYLLEIIPVTHLSYKGETETKLRWHLGRPRVIKPGQLIHSSALKLDRDPSARLPKGHSWADLKSSVESHMLIEPDPYTKAKYLVSKIKDSMDKETSDRDVHVEHLKSLISTEPGLMSLSDAPDPDNTLIILLELHSKIEDAAAILDASRHIVTKNAGIGKKYTPDQLREIHAYCQSEETRGLLGIILAERSDEMVQTDQ